MTDAEMVKAMEICKDKEIPCDDCPLVKCGDCEEISRQYFYDRFKQLQSENAALRERLEKAVELPVPLETPILKVWENRVPTDWTRMSFVNIWEITTVNFKLEHFPLWGKYYFPNTEKGKKAAEARLAELKGE